jgi:hypothetical protein
VEHKLGDLAAENAIKLKAGVYAERKDRNFDARFFGYVNGDTTLKRLPVDQIFNPENVSGGDINTFAVQEEFNPSNRYEAANTLLAGYARQTFPSADSMPRWACGWNTTGRNSTAATGAATGSM